MILRILILLAFVIPQALSKSDLVSEAYAEYSCVHPTYTGYVYKPDDDYPGSTVWDRTQFRVWGRQASTRQLLPSCLMS